MSTASLELACVLEPLPESFCSEHALVEIQTAYRLGFIGLPVGKREAVRLAFRAGMELGEATGKGYKAGKRCAKIAEAAAVEVAAINQRLSVVRRWRFADRVEEMRTEARSRLTA